MLYPAIQSKKILDVGASSQNGRGMSTLTLAFQQKLVGGQDFEDCRHTQNCTGEIVQKTVF